MHLTGMKIKAGSHPAFEQDIELKLDERVNLFIGPNASGKTSLLRVLAQVGFLDNARLVPFGLPQISISDDWNQEFQVPDGEGAVCSEDSSSDGIDDRPLVAPWVYIPATRIDLPGEHDKSTFPFDDDQYISQDFRHPFGQHWPDNSQFFNNGWVSFLVGSLLYPDLRLQRIELDQFRHTLRLAYQCAKSISGEVIVGGPANYVWNLVDDAASNEIDPLAFEPDLLPGMPFLLPGMSVLTNAGDRKEATRQFAGNLSSGTQGSYLWVLYIALKMLIHYRYKEGWDKKPAILLIDEIENHLHPTWQRRVIPALLKHFPGLQIFATTHSPFVVAGLKAGQVHVLNRDTNGVVTASTNERDVIGWTADEILRGMMGVEEPTDQLTVDRANRLRELREKDELNEQEEEELNRLRRQVNEDLLNKRGPLEAQRERYADLVQDFLRMRQSELTQDGE